MYNEEIKERFLKSYKSDKVRNIVKMYGEIEEKHKQDLYYLPYDIILDEIAKMQNVKSLVTYEEYVFYAKRYKEWCMIENIFDHDVPLNSSKLDHELLKQKFRGHMGTILVKSFVELHEEIDFLDYDISNDYMSIQETLKMIFLLLFHGIPESVVFGLTTENIKVARNGLFIVYDNIMIQIVDKELESILEKRLKVSKYGYSRGRSFRRDDIGNTLISFGGKSSNIRSDAKGKMDLLFKAAYGKNTEKKLKLSFKLIFHCGVISMIKHYDLLNGQKSSFDDVYEWFEKKRGMGKLKKTERDTITEMYLAW